MRDACDHSLTGFIVLASAIIRPCGIGRLSHWSATWLNPKFCSISPYLHGRQARSRRNVEACAQAKTRLPSAQIVVRDRFLVRKQYFEESLGELKRIQTMNQITPEKITRESLEEDARQGSLRNATPESRFWARQKTWSETVEIGGRLISASSTTESRLDRMWASFRRGVMA